MTLRLQRILDDGDLAGDAHRVIAQASRFKATNGGVTAQTITDSAVVTGDGNVVQHGRSNINIGTATGVSIGPSEEEDG